MNAEPIEECCECHQFPMIWNEKGQRFFEYHYSIFPKVCKGKPSEVKP